MLRVNDAPFHWMGDASNPHRQKRQENSKETAVISGGLEGTETVSYMGVGRRWYEKQIFRTVDRWHYEWA
jgi:hypothetical protein